MSEIASSTAMAPEDDLIRLRRGGQDALADLFAAHRRRLERMVAVRMDGRLGGRVDAADVLQEAYLDASRRLRGYLADPRVPPFLWLRLIIGQRLIGMHRRHLQAQKRDARQEVALTPGGGPAANSAELSRELLGRLTSPSLAAVRKETKALLAETLAKLDSLDREILTLRHYEELTNNEVAEELGISKAAASNRYVRALARLKDTLAACNAFRDA